VAVAVVPIPTGTPDRSEIRLRRLSGRPVPMYEDPGKTVGPIYATLLDPSGDLYADTGLYELSLKDPAGNLTVVQVQIGEGQTAAVDPETITPEELELILADERSLALSRFAATDGAERITAEWTFAVPPLGPDGFPLGSVADSSGELSQAAHDALLEELDVRYWQPDNPVTVSGVVDFTNPPTINGREITAGGDTAVLDRLASVEAKATAAVLAAEAAQRAAEQLAGTAPPEETGARVSFVRLRVRENNPAQAPAGVGRFPGDPGAGVLLTGANNGQSSGTYTGYSIETFDSTLIYPASLGYTSATRPRSSCVREFQPGFLIASGMRTDARRWMTEGRLPILSFHRGGYTAQGIVDGNADADIDSNLAFFDSLKDLGPWAGKRRGGLVVTFHHEPEDNYPDGTGNSPAQYRAAFRHIVGRSRAAGVTNVAWSSPMYMAPYTFTAGSGRDWKQWHPDWNGSAWAFQTVDVDGIDLYNPNVNPTATMRNRTWASHSAWMLEARLRDRARQLPWCIGELGLRTDLPSLDDNGVTVAQILAAMANDGPAQGLFAAAAWNSNTSRFDEQNDPGGTKRAAWRAMNARPNVSLLAPAG